MVVDAEEGYIKGGTNFCGWFCVCMLKGVLNQEIQRTKEVEYIQTMSWGLIESKPFHKGGLSK